MPYRHPLGVDCLTTTELFDRIAQSEGKGQTGGEVMSEMFDEMEQSRLEYENKLRQPDVALAELREIVERWNKYELDEAREFPKHAKAYPPDIYAMPVKVLQVLNAEFGESFSGHSKKLVVMAVADNGKLGKLTVSDTYYSGSFYEPPDGETNIEWEFQQERRAGR